MVSGIINTVSITNVKGKHIHKQSLHEFSPNGCEQPAINFIRVLFVIQQG